MLTAILGSTLLGAVVAGGAALVGSFLNRKSTKEANKQNQENFETQMEYQQTVDNRNYEQTERWNQQNQYNLENQFSIAAKDAAKNGINPLSLNGASAGTASFSSASSSGSPSAPDMKAADYSAIGDVFNTIAQAGIERIRLKQQKSIADDQLNIQQTNAETAQTQASTDQYRAETDRMLAQAQIANLNKKTDTGTITGQIAENIKDLDKVIPSIQSSDTVSQAAQKVIDYLGKPVNVTIGTNASPEQKAEKAEEVIDRVQQFKDTLDSIPNNTDTFIKTVRQIGSALKKFMDACAGAGINLIGRKSVRLGG